MDRRKFIQKTALGSLPLMGAGLLSCESVTDASASTDWTVDYNIMKEIATLEAQMVNTYQDAIDSKLSAPNIAVAQLFQSHHREHLDSYNTTLRNVDWSIVESNDLHPDYNIAGDEQETLEFALFGEYLAANFYYSKLVEGLGSATIRKLFADIFPIEMGHVVSFKSLLGLTNPNGAGGLFEDFKSGL